MWSNKDRDSGVFSCLGNGRGGGRGLLVVRVIIEQFNINTIITIINVYSVQ